EPEQGRLPAAGEAHQHECLPFVDVEGHVVDAHGGAELLGVGLGAALGEELEGPLGARPEHLGEVAGGQLDALARARVGGGVGWAVGCAGAIVGTWVGSRARFLGGRGCHREISVTVSGNGQVRRVDEPISSGYNPTTLAVTLLTNMRPARGRGAGRVLAWL